MPIDPEDCPTPEYHSTHRYCPSCTWTEDDEWKPRYLVQKAPGVDGPAIPDDEPVVVIRAQDALALLMMDQYLLLYETVYEHMGTGADWRVIEDLRQHRRILDEWQRKHPDRVKRADR